MSDNATKNKKIITLVSLVRHIFLIINRNKCNNYAKKLEQMNNKILPNKSLNIKQEHH